MTALIDACAAAGFRQMIGYIDAANVASIKLQKGSASARSAICPRSATNSAAGRIDDDAALARARRTEPPAA